VGRAAELVLELFSNSGVLLSRSGMTSDRKKPGVAFWATVVAVVVLVAYPLSWGPVWCLCWTKFPSAWRMPAVLLYAPLVWVIDNGPDWLGELFLSYEELWLSLLGGA
jgi:hypothetical protein